MGKRDKKKAAREGKPNEAQTESPMDDLNENSVDIQDLQLGEVNSDGTQPVTDQTQGMLSSGEQTAGAVSSEEQTVEESKTPKVSITEKFSALIQTVKVKFKRAPKSEKAVKAGDDAESENAAGVEDTAKSGNAAEFERTAKSGNAAEFERTAKSGNAAGVEDTAKSGNVAEFENTEMSEDAESGTTEKPEKKSKPERTPRVKREWKKPNIKIRLPLDKLKDRRVVTLGIFAIVALTMILLGILLLKIPVVPACALIVIETVLAVLLHNTELWTHGMLLLAEIIAGILAGQVVFVAFCVIVYVAATISIQILSIEEKAVRRKS